MKRIHYAWFILVGCCALQLAGVGIAASCAGVFLTPVSAALGVKVNELSLYMTIQNITMLLLYPKAGKLLGRYDVRLTVSLPVVGISLGFLLLSRATSLFHFYAVALLLGSCFSVTTFLAIPLLINNWFYKKTGFALGIALAMSGIGGSVFAVLVGSIIENAGWRAGYMTIAGLVAVIVLPFSVFVLRLRPADKGLLPYGMEEAPAERAAEPTRGAQPQGGSLSDFTGTASFRYLLVFGGMMGLLAALQPNITVFAGSLGCGTTVSASVGSVVMLSALVAKLILGAANDRLGISKTVMAAAAPGMVAVVCFLLAAQERLFLLFGGAALYGIVIAFTTVQSPILVRATFGQENYGLVFPRIQQAYSLMSAVALPAYTTLYVTFGSYRPVIGILMAALLVAVFCALRTQGAQKTNG